MKNKILHTNAKYHEKVSVLLQELSTFSEETLNRRPADGGWSALQTAWHLVFVEERSLQYVQKKIGYGGAFDKAGIGAKWRTFWLLIAMRSPLKFKAPQASGTDSLPKQSNIQEIMERWTTSQSNWTEFLVQMPENLIDRAVLKHPRAGRIGWLQMLDFFEIHFDRHLGQIRRALKS